MEQPTILVADDNDVNRVLLKLILEKEGFRAVLAEDGPSARAMATADPPDLVLLDVMMPDEDGFETCARLRADRQTADIPVIFLSARDDTKSKVRGLQNGGVDYIAKPFDSEEVLARVRVHLRIRDSNRALVEAQRAKLRGYGDAQQAILAHPEDCPAAAFAVAFRPFEEASGDFYDVVRIADDVFGYFVADVAGHSVAASFLTATLKVLFRQYTGLTYSPEDTLRAINAVIGASLADEQYLTACYARVNRRRRQLSVVSAGHPAPVLVPARREPMFIEGESDPLGVFGSVVIHRHDVAVEPGDRLFLYTDGMIEGQPGVGRRAASEHLARYCLAMQERPLGAVEEVMEALRPSGLPATDDLLLMAIDLLP